MSRYITVSPVSFDCERVGIHKCSQNLNIGYKPFKEAKPQHLDDVDAAIRGLKNYREHIEELQSSDIF